MNGIRLSILALILSICRQIRFPCYGAAGDDSNYLGNVIRWNSKTAVAADRVMTLQWVTMVRSSSGT
jgi:hypothetical protein